MDLCANSVQVKKQKRDYIPVIPLFFSDLGRIQTCNLLSRNQVHYSVMLRGRFVGANIIAFFIIGYYFIDVLKNNTKKKAPSLLGAFSAI